MVSNAPQLAVASRRALVPASRRASTMTSQTLGERHLPAFHAFWSFLCVSLVYSIAAGVLTCAIGAVAVAGAGANPLPMIVALGGFSAVVPGRAAIARTGRRAASRAATVRRWTCATYVLAFLALLLGEAYTAALIVGEAFGS
jgi:hypothetical protein